MNKILKTRVVRYRYDYDTRDQEENKSIKKEYMDFCRKIKAMGLKKFAVLSCQITNKNAQPENGSIELETSYLFNNQWNAKTKNLRVFDWYEVIYPNKKIKDGYYIVQTDAMKEIRSTVTECGYCGKLHYDQDQVFCADCLDSPYLEEKDLFLLRLLPVKNTWDKRAKLTNEEKVFLLPLYIKRQTTGEDSRNAKKLKEQRENLKKKYDKTVGKAKEKFEGMTWLMDQGISINNVIYYDHTKIFSFGWQNKLSVGVASALENKLENFPFTYEIKKEG